MKAKLLCGEKELPIDVPDHSVMLNPNPAFALADPKEKVLEAIDNPIGTAPLATLAKGRKNACVVISDVTRPVPNRVLLPPILNTLESSGIAREDIVILIATGMHRPNLGEELKQVVGAEIMANYRIENHYCRKEEDLRHVADIDGAPIEINRFYLDADLKILTGLIEPHMYAGYSGGRKSILPGISSYKTMTFMHSFAMIDHPDVTNCKLDGNPFHQAGEKVAQMVGVDFIVNVIINKQREMVSVFAGHHSEAHVAGCKQVEQMAVQKVPEQVDLVITSAGGYPLDATFYQVSKGLIAASNLMREGGSIIMACECREGFGSVEYCEMIKEGCSAEEFMANRCKPENFEIDQWCLQTTYQALAKASNVYVYSPYLDEKELEEIGIIKIDNIQAAINKLTIDHQTVAVSHEGPYVVGLVDDVKAVSAGKRMPADGAPSSA